MQWKPFVLVLREKCWVHSHQFVWGRHCWEHLSGLIRRSIRFFFVMTLIAFRWAIFGVFQPIYRYQEENVVNACHHYGAINASKPLQKWGLAMGNIFISSGGHWCLPALIDSYQDGSVVWLCDKINYGFLLFFLLNIWGVVVAQAMREYMQCLKESKFSSERCRRLSSDYLKCRMDRCAFFTMQFHPFSHFSTYFTAKCCFGFTVWSFLAELLCDKPFVILGVCPVTRKVDWC